MLRRSECRRLAIYLNSTAWSHSVNGRPRSLIFIRRLYIGNGGRAGKGRGALSPSGETNPFQSRPKHERTVLHWPWRLRTAGASTPTVSSTYVRARYTDESNSTAGAVREWMQICRNRLDHLRFRKQNCCQNARYLKSFRAVAPALTVSEILKFLIFDLEEIDQGH